MRVAREAYELSVRYGIGQMSQWIIGSLAWGALYEGLDWETALEQMDSELGRSRSAADRGRLLAIREMFMIVRGEDIAVVRAERERLESAVSDPDVEQWKLLMPAHEAFYGGEAALAVERYRKAVPLTSQNSLDARVGLILAAHFACDVEAAREGRQALADEPLTGRFVEGAGQLAEAGIAALEGRAAEARDGFEAAIELWRLNGARLFVAIAQVDALHSLPDDPAIDSWADEARERFEVIRSPMLLARLDEAIAARRGRRSTSPASTADQAVS
jgi:hypothetical protein